MTIRRMILRDVPQIAELHKHTIPGLSPNMGRGYLNNLYRILIENPKLHQCFVAEKKGELVGAITTTCNRKKTKKILDHITWSPYVAFHLLRAIFLVRISLADVFNRLLFERKFSQVFPNQSATILTLFVDSNNQQEGIGTSLVQKITDQYKAKGVNELHVETKFDNKKALLFYQSVGFKPTRMINNFTVLTIAL